MSFHLELLPLSLVKSYFRLSRKKKTTISLVVLELMDPIREVSDPPGSMKSVWERNKARDAVTARAPMRKHCLEEKAHLKKARPWETERQLGTTNIPLAEGKWW